MESKQRAEEWLEHIKAWECSGDPQKVFCEARGISYNSFVYWKSQLKDEKIACKAVKTNALPAVSFIPLAPSLPSTNANSVQLKWSDGVSLHCSAQDFIMLASTLKQLRCLP
jgi:predicted secreted Zn-dependent protease